MGSNDLNRCGPNVRLTFNKNRQNAKIPPPGSSTSNQLFISIPSRKRYIVRHSVNRLMECSLSLFIQRILAINSELFFIISILFSSTSLHR